MVDVAGGRIEDPGGTVTEGRVSDVRRHEASMVAGVLNDDSEG